MRHFFPAKILCFLSGAILSATLFFAYDAAKAITGHYSPYRKLDVFAQVLSYVENDYIEAVDDTKLIYGALQGMLKKLDRHSKFFPPQSYRTFKSDTEGEFCGLGVEVEKHGKRLMIIKVMPDSVAAQAGLKAGHQIMNIGKLKLKTLSMSQLVDRMRGPATPWYKFA